MNMTDVVWMAGSVDGDLSVMLMFSGVFFVCRVFQSRRHRRQRLRVSILNSFLRYLFTSEHPVQCFDAVGWASGRASGL